MITKIHAIAAVLATLCIATFFSSTIIVELFGSPETIAYVKGLVVTTGGTGFAMGNNRKGKLVEGKRARMPFIAANGLLVLLPSAIFLDQWAAAASMFDTKFYIVQSLELIAGAVNLTLMGKNMRDGLKMTGKLRRKK